MTHLCVSKLTIIDSDNGLWPGWRRQPIIWTNAEILLNGLLGTSVSEILIEFYKCSFKKMHLKMSSGKWGPFCFGLNVLRLIYLCSPLIVLTFFVLGMILNILLGNGSQNGSIYSLIQGAVSIRKTVLPGMAIPMLKIRRPNGRLIFNMEIAIRR